MTFLTLLPLAVVMVAGTQLVAAVFFASSDRPRAASLGYLAGAAIVVCGGTTVAWLAVRLFKISFGGGDRAAVERWIDWFVLALLAVLAVVVFLRRHTGPPAWMGRLQHAGPGYALKVGLLLFLAMPANDLTMITVGASAARHGLPWWHLLPFVLLTVGLLAIPLLALLLLGRRAAVVLPRVRDWADSHSWLVSEAVIAFFVLITILDLAR
ncbi:GAP family protein [Micromonospora sp. WMMD1082]|uniref:GAP family protein n=1 Tax=Micromonospora sp. WMMD1082 TaxID=3016104 RepID=UPI002415C42E|nr:GAP family protein [Micromonospora sp. WMMD1082]MDG4794752.1 GAP family protein [Micromonospora sp. WMMD1082]